MCPYSTTTDGFEMQFGVNHLVPARIINLSSITHSMGKIQFDDLNSEKSYHPVKAYVQSKLANVLFTRELARRLEGTGVTIYAVDPGVVYTRAIRHMKSFIQMFVKAFQFLIRTPAEGAYTTLYCAVTPELAKESGGYYCNCTPANCSRAASDDESARKLWKVSCHLLGIRNFFCPPWSSDARLDGKTVIITGANTGIGKETALDLARRGARIIMACRDMEKAEGAQKEIIAESGNENIIVKKLDLSDTKSIREFAEQINKGN
ncbi:UNVERIFIED_CONTAM: hypothetical protein FKN15_011479 [Acipenser sinensis]